MHRHLVRAVFVGATLIALFLLFALASVRLEGLAGATP
jgi:hypothetical protein